MDLDRLRNMAKSVAASAYAPYSGFHVGAALECEDGTIVTGCNVENISFGLTQCAERAAVSAAVASGHRRFRRIAIHAGSITPLTPCGACCQVLAEFSPNMEIISTNNEGESWTETLDHLLPRPTAGILNVPRGT